MKHATRLILLCLTLSACSSTDMQGNDPRDYYAKHPIRNKVEMKSEEHMVHFQPGASKLTRGETELFRRKVNQRSMMAVDSVYIELPKAQMSNGARREALARMMKYLGYSGGDVRFQPSDALEREQAVIHLNYADAVLPDCPDWRKASSHNYSNTPHANFGCATETNLGLMVADPRDLERGTGDLPPASSERMERSLREWHSGRDFRGESKGGESGGGGGAGGAPDTTNIEPVSAQ